MIRTSAEAFSKSYHHAKKEEQNFFVKLLWSSLEAGRQNKCEEMAAAYNHYAEKYNLTPAFADISSDEVETIVNESIKFEVALNVASKYKNKLREFELMESAEDIDKSLLELKEASAIIAAKLWDKWLVSQTTSLSSADRKEMCDYIAVMKLVEDVSLAQNPEMWDCYSKMADKMKQYLQCWAVTSLSAKSKIPFTPGYFDYVIIDEASQCDIASIIPLLYRAKKAVIIGDPKQLSHISQIAKKQDHALLKKYQVSPAWSYSVNSAYNLAQGLAASQNIIQLRDHFRCCEEIIDFSNNVFYDGSLRTATKYNKLKTPSGEQPGIRWIDVHGTTVHPSDGGAFNQDEASAVVKELKRLVDIGYEGSIGVTTPFKKQAELIRKLLEKDSVLSNKLVKDHNFIADTVHKFQGDERDLMIFSLAVSNGIPESTLGFLRSTGNLFNVAITRARAILVVVGNYGFCKECSVPHLTKFTEYCQKLNSGQRKRIEKTVAPTSREYPKVANIGDVSIYEKKLYTALFDAGFKVIPQYPIDKYLLDFALLAPDGSKLDIEVDGVTYHRKLNGELCYRDQIRNQRMFELGWDVKRFWVYQIRDDMPWCIREISNWYNQKHHLS